MRITHTFISARLPLVAMDVYVLRPCLSDRSVRLGQLGSGDGFQVGLHRLRNNLLELFDDRLCTFTLQKHLIGDVRRLCGVLRRDRLDVLCVLRHHVTHGITHRALHFSLQTLIDLSAMHRLCRCLSP